MQLNIANQLLDELGVVHWPTSAFIWGVVGKLILCDVT